jgi:hypothetical protein
MAVLTEVVVGDTAEAWAGAGFAVESDGERPTSRVGTVRLGLAGPDRGRGILRWALEPGEPGAIDGLPTETAPSPAGGPAHHPNGALVLDHVVVVTADVDRTSDAFVAAGLDLRRVRPVPRSEPRRVQVFFRAGEVIIELVGPERAAGDGPARFYGLAFTVADLDATAALLGDRLSEIRPAVQPGRRIATLRHRDLDLTVPVAFLSQRADDDASRAGGTPV